MSLDDELFPDAILHWDLPTLYADLSCAKGKPLTPVEKLHLRGLLMGYSPSDIAGKLHKNLNGVETDLCATVYRYVKSLLDKMNERVDNWRNISQWLEDAGYKYRSPQVPMNQLSIGKSIVNISNIRVEDSQVVIVITLRIPTIRKQVLHE